MSSPEPEGTGRVLSTRPVARPGRDASSEPGPLARGAAALDTVATGWLLVVCSMIVWSLAPVLWGWQPSLIMSSSMMPRLAPGDVVLVAPPASDRPVQRGQIVLVRDPVAPTGRVLHRVIHVAPDGMLTTQGDANPSPDVLGRSPDEVLGVARLVVPAAGRLALLRAGGDTAPRHRLWVTMTLAAVAVFVATRVRHHP